MQIIYIISKKGTLILRITPGPRGESFGVLAHIN